MVSLSNVVNPIHHNVKYVPVPGRVSLSHIVDPIHHNVKYVPVPGLG
jgi:hypothetical protein